MRVLIVTIDGSLSTMPCPRTYTTVLAVPRSTAMSRPMTLEYQGAVTEELSGGLGTMSWQGYDLRWGRSSRVERVVAARITSSLPAATPVESRHSA